MDVTFDRNEKFLDVYYLILPVNRIRSNFYAAIDKVHLFCPLLFIE
jgi:hypothetical protein